MTETEQSTEAKQEILSSIREHLAASARFDAQVAQAQTVQRREKSNSAKNGRNGTLIELFRQALEAVSGHCVIVQTIDEAARAVQHVVDARKARHIAVSDSSFVKGIVGQLKTEAVFLDAPHQAELFDCDIGITGAQWAIAETGTLVLESECERHRLASLVPPVHVAVVQADRIRRTMSEILELIKNSDVGLNRTVTFITGPSRTSDIELTLAIGVHGPGELHVIVIDEPSQPA
jgi:L-lactate dehydrogenase complex protein LldG